MHFIIAVHNYNWWRENLANLQLLTNFTKIKWTWPKVFTNN